MKTFQEYSGFVPMNKQNKQARQGAKKPAKCLPAKKAKPWARHDKRGMYVE